MAALCCCVSRRKHTQDARSHHPHNIVDGHQERPQQIPRALPQKLDSNAVIETDKEARIKEIPFGAPAHLDELVVDDDDDSDTGGEEPQPHLTRQASAALGAVRARFTRHRSSESDVKRQSTASVGKSQEEIARRAELRRLRHKRIQDELKHELEGQLSTDQTSNASIKSARPGSLTSPSQSQPGGGPRDTIEFAVLDGNQVSPKSPSLAPSLGSRKSSPNKPQLSQKVSSIDPKSDQDGDIMHQDKPPVPDTQAEPRDPKPDFQLLPHSKTRSTFRLSNSPSWLDRIIGVDNTFSETGEHPSLDGRSALSIWLAAQGLRSRDSSMANLDRDTKTEAGQEHGSEEAKLPDEISISVSDIFHRSGSSHTGLQPSREVAPVRGSSLTSAHWRPHNHLAEPASTTDEGLQRVTKSPSEDLALDYAAALAFTSPNDHTSSQYASRAQSFQPSPSRSKPNLHHLDTLDLQDMRLSPFEWHSNVSVQREVGRSEAQSSYATAQDHASSGDLAMQPPRNDHTADPDLSERMSFTQSETASFHIREAELQTIEERFAGVLSRQKPRPFNSRFREEFNDAAESVEKKPSLIPRLVHLHVPGKVQHKPKEKSTGDIEQQHLHSHNRRVTGNPVPNRSDPKSSSSGQKASLTPAWNEIPPRPGLKESATDLWQRAIRQEAEQRQGRLSKSGTSSRPSFSHSKNSLEPKSEKYGHSQMHSHASGSGGTGQYLRVPHATTTPSQSRWNLPRWSTLGNKQQNLHEGWPRLPMDLAVAPESWAKYPTHDRKQRNAHARSEDNVNSLDFAIRHVSSEGQMGWTTDKNAAKEENTPNRRSVSMHGKLGKAVKSGITKLFPFTENLGETRTNSLGRRRGSFQMAGEVEYPELEVLPPGIGHILEPEQVADVMSSRKRSCTRSSHHSFGHSSTKAIEFRRSAAFSDQRQQQSLDSTLHDTPQAAKSVEVLPRTPHRASEHEDKQSTSRNEIFVTPLSTTPLIEAGHDKTLRHSRLPVAKSEQALPYLKVQEEDGADTGWVRSFTWSGSLLTSQSPSELPRRGHHELHILRRPGELNASKESFVTGASFATAKAE